MLRKGTMNHSPPGTGTVKDDWSDGGGEAAPGQFVVLWDREKHKGHRVNKSVCENRLQVTSRLGAEI